MQENEDEKLSKEEQDMAWEVYRKTSEWEEMQRVSLDESAIELKPVIPDVAPPKPEPEMIHLRQPKGIFRVRLWNGNALILPTCSLLEARVQNLVVVL